MRGFHVSRRRAARPRVALVGVAALAAALVLPGRAAAGTWLAPSVIAPTSGDAFLEAGASDAFRGTLLLWGENTPAEVIRAAYKPAGGAWNVFPDPVAVETVAPFDTPLVGMDAAGNVVAAWNECISPFNCIARAATLARGGPWSSPVGVTTGVG